MMEADDRLFALSANPQFKFEILGGAVPAIIVDDVYERPDDIREMALQLRYATPPYPYPGKLAEPLPSASLTELVNWALDKVNKIYLPNVPPMQIDGRPIKTFQGVHTDFGIVDIHPGELSEGQRIPHVDPVPVFGLVYLNREQRGGTLFFEHLPGAARLKPGSGYMSAESEGFRLRARIEGVFNRLAIYPGFVPHSGEISGDWIEGDQRFTSPRLTQRLVFIP